MLKRLHLELNDQGLIDLQTWMIDSTAVRTTCASSGARKGGDDEPADHALGRSRGGQTTKIHRLCVANGVPLRALLSGRKASDISYTQPLLDDVSIPKRITLLRDYIREVTERNTPLLMGESRTMDFAD